MSEDETEEFKSEFVKSVQHVPHTSQMIAGLICPSLLFCLALAHVMIPIYLWVLSVFVGAVLLLLQEIVEMEIDIQRREVTVITFRPLLTIFLEKHSKTIQFDQIREAKVYWKGQRALEENRRNEVSACCHSERSLIQSTTVLRIIHRDHERDPTRWYRLDVLEFQDLLGIEKYYVPTLHSWCQLLRDHIPQLNDDEEQQIGSEGD